MKVNKDELLQQLKVAGKLPTGPQQLDDCIQIFGSQEDGKLFLESVRQGAIWYRSEITAVDDPTMFEPRMMNLDMLTRLVDRMPSGVIKLVTDGASKIKVSGGRRRGTLSCIDDRFHMGAGDQETTLLYEGTNHFTELAPKLASVTANGSGAWDCAAFFPENGKVYASVRGGNIFAADFPMTGVDHPIMVSASLLTPLAMLPGDIRLCLQGNGILVTGEGWGYFCVRSALDAPTYPQVLSRFTSAETMMAHMGVVVSEMKDLYMAVKGTATTAKVDIRRGKVKMKTGQWADQAVSFETEKEIEHEGNLAFEVTPGNFLAIAPLMVGDGSVSVAKVPGSHMFMTSPLGSGTISCISDSLVYE